MSIQPLPIIIMSLTISQNSPRDNGVITILIIEKKSRKVKISSTFSIKEVFIKAKHLSINNFLDDLANIMGSTFLQIVKGQVDNEDYILAYYYYLSLIFYSFNQVDLDVLFFISLLFS